MDRLDKYVEGLKKLPSELRGQTTWRYCAEEAVVRGGGGFVVGFAAALVFMRAGRPFGRGAMVGLGAGGGLGSAYEHCNERFLSLQASASAAAASEPAKPPAA